MKLSVEKFLKKSGITEPFYPGKRLVKQCRQAGDYKSHCVVFDWRDPSTIRVEIKAGLSGRTLAVEQVKQYPVSFQSPTFIEIEVNDNDNEKEEEEEEGKASGKSGSGGSGGMKKKKNLESMGGLMAKAFGDIVEGKIPDSGTVKEMVVMGMEIAAEAFESVMGEFSRQLSHAKIGATDLLSKAGKFITKYTPPAFMAPTGNEDATYKYDREKNNDIGLRTPSM